MDRQKQEHAFVIDTLAHLLAHIARTDESETGNKEILYTLISQELKHQSAMILKS